MRSPGELLVEIRQALGWTLDDLARRSSTSAPTLSDYEHDRKEPRVSTTDRILEVCGYRLRLEVVPRELDRPTTRKDRRSLAMHRIVARKLLNDPESVRSKALRNLRTLRQADADERAAVYLDEWARLLDAPTDALVETLVSERQSARDLRQVSPFAGVLTPAERQRIIAAVRRPMRHDQFEHVIRAAGEVVGSDELIVIGSQAILASFERLPMRQSRPSNRAPVRAVAGRRQQACVADTEIS